MQLYTTFSWNAVKYFFEIGQKFYPERCYKIYVVGAGWLFRFFYGMAKPFLSKKTTDDVVVLNEVDEL